jgi:hypothetical protein
MATIGDDGAVVFDWTLWQAEYFALAQKGVTQAAATAAFAKAGMFVNNTGLSPVQDADQRQAVLNDIAAHLLQLQLNSAAGGGVGRISSASEGSVSVSFDMPTTNATEAWWMQTAYGATALQILRKYALARVAYGPNAYRGGRYGYNPYAPAPIIPIH